MADNITHLYAGHPSARVNARSGPGQLAGALAIRKALPITSQFFLMTGPLAYIGGKQRIATRIIEIFPKHTTYVEPFAGGAQVFFHKEPSRVEVLNDLDGEIVNFFRMCQLHHQELLRQLKFCLVSRKWFDLVKLQNPKSLTDIQRAARLFYLQKNSFAGLVRYPAFHYHVVRPPSFNVGSLPTLLENVHKRLERVQIECLPYEEILARYDRTGTLFYLDPPYWGRKLYKVNFTESDFVNLEERLRHVKGKFVLSLNDIPAVRRLFRRYVVRGIQLSYTAQMTAGKRFREVLIMNYTPAEHPLPGRKTSSS